MELHEYKGAILKQQALFAENYVANGYKSGKAAADAKYSAKTAHAQGSRLLRDVKVKAYIDALEADKWAITKLDAEKQKTRMEWLQTSDIRHYLTFDGKKLTFKPFDQLTDAQAYAIKGIKHTRHGFELTLHDKSWTIPEVNRILGMYSKDNEQKGEALAAVVAVLLPDNTRGKVVPHDVIPDEPPA